MMKPKTNPPGRIKIMAALTDLMESKDFHSITTAEIAGRAGVTEGLIYKYFKDKKDLLYQVLGEHFQAFFLGVESRARQRKTCVAQLEEFIAASLESYSANRVFSRILLLEVRNSPVFFQSVAYEMVRDYAGLLLKIIQAGMDSGELKPGIDARLLRKVILGAIEHACLGEVIFNREFNPERTAAGISNIVLNGVGE